MSAFAMKLSLLEKTGENRGRFLAGVQDFLQFVLGLGQISFLGFLVIAEFVELGFDFVSRRLRFDRRAQIFFRLRFFRAETRTIAAIATVASGSIRGITATTSATSPTTRSAAKSTAETTGH